MSGILFILLFAFIIALFIFAGVVNFVLSILRGIFSLGRNNKSTQQSTTSQSQSSRKKNESIYFNKEEALDAEYEEIK